MTCAQVDMIIEQGATFERSVQWLNEDDLPISLTGFSAKMQIRATYSNPVALVTLTSPGGGLMITPLLGRVDIRIGADVTATVPLATAVYDLELTLIADPTQVHRLIEGKVTVTPQVTLP